MVQFRSNYLNNKVNEKNIYSSSSLRLLAVTHAPHALHLI